MEVDDLFDGFPIKSHFFKVGRGLLKATQSELALEALKRGAESDGCVPCIEDYCVGMATTSRRKHMLYSVLPLALEGSIRGSYPCKVMLASSIYLEETILAVFPNALVDYWMKNCKGGSKELPEMRKDTKEKNGNFCIVCEKRNSEDNDVTLVKCGKCKYYSYCGKDCQLKLLHKYHKPYAKEIRDAIKNGEDAKSISRLQVLREKLGLSRPKEDYEELVRHLNDSSSSIHDNNYNNNCVFSSEYVVAKKDGTVPIGSTPKMM